MGLHSVPPGTVPHEGVAVFVILLQPANPLMTTHVYVVYEYELLPVQDCARVLELVNKPRIPKIMSITISYMFFSQPII